MSNTEYNTNTVPPTVHVDLVLTQPPYVQPVAGYPDSFALHLGDLRAYFTLQQWNELDTKVRAAVTQVTA
jgi:hypothetical protein